MPQPQHDMSGLNPEPFTFASRPSREDFAWILDQFDFAKSRPRGLWRAMLLIAFVAAVLGLVGIEALGGNF